MRSASTGVGLSFLPVTTFMSSTLLPSSIDVETERRDVDHHVARAEIVGQPAPALHVHRDLLDRGRVALLPAQRELMLQSRDTAATAAPDRAATASILVLAERRDERVVQIDVARRGVPVRIDVFRIDRAVRQIPGVTQVGVGGAQVEVNRLV